MQEMFQLLKYMYNSQCLLQMLCLDPYEVAEGGWAWSVGGDWAWSVGGD